MENLVKESIWHQFLASLEMLENAIKGCPLAVWADEARYWYICYHTLFFLDYYLCLEPASFVPPEPFTDSEFEDEPPPRVYNQDELLIYLSKCRENMKAIVSALNAETAALRWINQSNTMNYSRLEILLYNMRHVQHHTGQLNRLLSRKAGIGMEWVYQTSLKLD